MDELGTRAYLLDLLLASLCHKQRPSVNVVLLLHGRPLRIGYILLDCLCVPGAPTESDVLFTHTNMFCLGIGIIQQIYRALALMFCESRAKNVTSGKRIRFSIISDSRR